MQAEEIIIRPGNTERNYWKDIWRYRELFYILSWRDIKVRYKQTVIGAAWSVIRPLLTTIIFTILFSKVARLENPGAAPYALMVFAGMLPWQFFANALSESSGSLISNANLITKVYFPRMIIPASSVITSLVDFAISASIMAIMMIWMRFLPPLQVLFLPLFVAMTFVCAFGFGLYFTALNVKYRDFKYIVPFIVQFGLYITPIGFPSSVIPEEWQLLYSMNPMVGITDAFRWCLLGDPFKSESFIFSLVISSVSMILSIRYFRTMERNFADNV